MTYDPKVPQGLKETQCWFGGIIARPIDEESRIHPVGLSGRAIKEEAAERIVPSSSLLPFQRMEIYNQQFWWRLLNVLHKEFPFLTRVFGYRDFNAIIGKPYIAKYLPNHWSLSFLGNRLLRWIDEDYHEKDKPFIRDIAALDLAYETTFVAGHNPPIGANPQDSLAITERKLHLQPHIVLFAFEYDLFKLRNEFLKESVDYWLDNPFPSSGEKGQYYFILFRNTDNLIDYERIESAEYHLLKCFEGGSTIDQALEWLETQNEEVNQEVAQHLQHWLEGWIVNEWLW